MARRCYWFAGSAKLALLEHEEGFDASKPLTLTAQHMPGVQLQLTAEQAIRNCSMPRIWGGVHFRFSTKAAEALGRKLARLVLIRFAIDDHRSSPAGSSDASE